MFDDDRHEKEPCSGAKLIRISDDKWGFVTRIRDYALAEVFCGLDFWCIAEIKANLF